MPLLLLWLRREARLRWPALLACCLLVAIASATVLTATAGARRGASTVTRLLAVTRPATGEVVPSQSRWAALTQATVFSVAGLLPRDAAPDRPGRAGVRAAAGPDSRSPRGTSA